MASFPPAPLPHSGSPLTNGHRSKRRYRRPIEDIHKDAEAQDELWRDVSLFELDTIEQPTLYPSDSALISFAANKRKYSDISDNLAHVPVGTLTGDVDFFLTEFPALFPSVPLFEERAVEPHLPNPFLDGSDERHPTLENRKVTIVPEDGAVDGYIKFRMQKNNTERAVAMPRGLSGVLRQKEMGVHHNNKPAVAPPPGTSNTIQHLPPNFATQLKLDETDKRLMRFFLSAFCKGRTLLRQSNFWYVDIAPMASGNECVKHALLSFSSAYVLDYCPTEPIRQRANLHYRKAVQLLDEELQKPDSSQIGKEDAIVAAMVLLLSNDVVNWEERRPKELEPLWREGARSARLILDHSNPGYRYWSPNNVQATTARSGNANWIAYVDICAQPVTPLSTENTEKLYSWLLQGSPADVRRIHGATGVSPKLLHTFAQITHLAARMTMNPSSTVIPLGAAKLEQRLERFHQWSDLSPGFDTWEELSAACNLDENGKVTTQGLVTDLSAYAWVPAAQIYLDCRFHRKPRTHPHVQERLKVLQQCITRLPCTGRLFTSQSPFFAVFIMALVAVSEEDRTIARQWFEIVLSGASCRSSVPPVWTALQNTWTWMDAELVEEEWDTERPLGDRLAWWEVVVSQLVSTEGVLSLV